MKKVSQNETAMLDMINKVQIQLLALDKKLDTLINRPVQAERPSPKPPVERIKFTAICADCKKECTIPFKPSGDRPVYCQDCFSRRKMVSLSGITVPTAQAETPKPKKPAAKKKTVPKKK